MIKTVPPPHSDSLSDRLWVLVIYHFYKHFDSVQISLLLVKTKYFPTLYGCLFTCGNIMQLCITQAMLLIKTFKRHRYSPTRQMLM